MKCHSVYYTFSTLTMDPCTLDDAWEKEARNTWLCAGCKQPRERRAFDLKIQERKLANIPLNMAHGCAVGIARKDFLFSFGEQVVRDYLYLGRLFGPDDSLLDDWVTFVGRYRIIVRGTKHAALRRCTECVNIWYFAMRPLYLYPRPREGVSIFHANFATLVVNADLGQRVNPKQWRKLDRTRLLVRDEPADGLGDIESVGI